MCLGGFDVLTVEGYSETALFQHLSNDVFHNLELQKYIGYNSDLFFQDH